MNKCIHNDDGRSIGMECWIPNVTCIGKLDWALCLRHCGLSFRPTSTFLQKSNPLCCGAPVNVHLYFLLSCLHTNDTTQQRNERKTSGPIIRNKNDCVYSKNDSMEFPKGYSMHSNPDYTWKLQQLWHSFKSLKLYSACYLHCCINSRLNMQEAFAQFKCERKTSWKCARRKTYNAFMLWLLCVNDRIRNKRNP